MNKNLATAIYLLSAAAAFVIPAYADHILIPYDWTIELQTQKLEHQFEYTGSHLHGIEKVNVAYRHTPTSADPDPHAQAYENFWYHDGKPFGQERKHEFGISQGDGISILVQHKEDGATDRECKAAANSILRVILDAYLNKNAVVNVRIPDASFDRIRQDLIDLGCQEHPPGPDESGAVAPAINIFLQTEPVADHSYTLYYM